MEKVEIFSAIQLLSCLEKIKTLNEYKFMKTLWRKHGMAFVYFVKWPASWCYSIVFNNVFPQAIKAMEFFHTFQALVGLVVVSSSEHDTLGKVQTVSLASHNNNAQSSFLWNLINHPFQKCLLITLEYRTEWNAESS